MPSFAHPWLLLLLPVAPLVAWWRLRRAQPALRFSDIRLLQGLPTGRGPLVRRLDAAFHGTAALCLVIAVAAIGCAMAIEKVQIIRGKEPATLATMFAGFGFMFQQPVVLGAISLDLFAVVLGGATALLPIYAKDILHTGPWGLGLLRSAPAVGALIVGIWLAKRPFEAA